MNILWNLVKKELRELITKSTILSVVVVIVLFVALGSFIGGEVNEATSAQKFGYIDASGGTYSQGSVASMKAYYTDHLGVDNADDYIIGLDAAWDDPSSILSAMESADVNTVIIFTPTFDSNITAATPQAGEVKVYWNQTNTSLFSSLDTATAELAITLSSSYISEKLLPIYGPGLNEAQKKMIKNPVSYHVDANTGSIGSTFLKGELHENVSPDNIYSAMSQITTFIPLVIMLIITMIGSILISSMGNEKENKTLETLLTLPISRTTVVAGKLIGCAIAGIILGAFYMVGMYFYIDGLTGSVKGSISMNDLGLVLGAADWLLVVVCLFLAILSALGLCMILGAFAKNYKAAQTYVLPIAVLAIIPMFVTMFSSFDALPVFARALLFLIPFTHPMMVVQNLVFGETALVLGGLVYLVAFTALMMWITVRLYKSDILLTGLVSKKNSKFGKKGAQEEE